MYREMKTGWTLSGSPLLLSINPHKDVCLVSLCCGLKAKTQRGYHAKGRGARTQGTRNGSREPGPKAHRTQQITLLPFIPSHGCAIVFLLRVCSRASLTLVSPAHVFPTAAFTSFPVEQP